MPWREGCTAGSRFSVHEGGGTRNARMRGRNVPHWKRWSI